MHRRHFLRLYGIAGIGTLAGCEGSSEDDGTPKPDNNESQTSPETGESGSQHTKLTPKDGDFEDLFGSAVAVSSDVTTAVIGASYDEDPNGRDSGSTYVFDASSGSWTQQAKLAPDDGDSEDGFGWSAAVSDDGTTAVVGLIVDQNPNDEDAGSAYVYTL